MPSSIKVIFGNLKIDIHGELPFCFTYVIFILHKKSVNITMTLGTNSHLESLLHYPLILVTKLRRQVIDNEISDYFSCVAL